MRRFYENRYKRYKEHRKSLAPIIGICDYCKNEFFKKKGNHIYCSHFCRDENRKIRINREKIFPAPILREIKESDILTSNFPEEIRAYKKSGKKIISFPHQPEPDSLDVFIDDIGTDNEKYSDDLENFNRGIKNGKFPRK